MSKSADDVRGLFDDAESDGLSQMSTNILVENLNTLTMAGATGTTADDLFTDEVTLAITVLDVSLSMSEHADTVIAAYNAQLDALSGSKSADSILMSTWLFNHRPQLLHGFLPLSDTPPMDANVYSPGGTTALYDTVLDALTSVVAYGQDLRNSGIVTKIDFAVMTDGEDNESTANAAKVKVVADDLLRQEIYTLTFTAFGGDFAKRVAADMGFPNVWEYGATASEIRRAMDERSQSIIRTSQSQIGKSGSFFS